MITGLAGYEVTDEKIAIGVMFEETEEENFGFDDPQAWITLDKEGNCLSSYVIDNGREFEGIELSDAFVKDIFEYMDEHDLKKRIVS